MLSESCTSRQWLSHFRQNAEQRRALPWSDPRRLTDAERQAVGSAVQQFQLGEGSEGRAFRLRAERWAVRQGDGWFGPAIAAFIAEEQRHSADLGRFLDLEGIPRLRSHWVDRVFRNVRRLAGLELMVTTLVTAEIMAVVFYTALQRATGSPVLQALCGQILADEAYHLEFQADTLGRIRAQRGEWRNSVATLLHWGLIGGTALLVWYEYGRVFAAAGVRFGSFWCETWSVALRFERLVQGPAEQAITPARGPA